MFRPLVSSLLALGAITAFAPAIAHQIQVSRDVGATLHIEPNDRPKAGESSLLWFALTRKGGDSVPLTACNCRLEIYAIPTAPDAVPLQVPSLRPVSAERYRGIPGADVTFPQAGAYLLKLKGTATGEVPFDPFELGFEVLVSR